MKVRTITELTAVDPRVPHFTPLGLSPSGVLGDGDAIAFIQEIVSPADLVPAVPDATRKSFERLRAIHTYGAFAYDLFTVADDLSLLVIELALAERFIVYYNGSIPFVLGGQDHPLAASSFDEVYAARHRGGSHHKGDWQLRSLATAALIPFRATLTDLVAWARHEGLLPGQRARRIDKTLVQLRNWVAHPHSYHLGSPSDSARAIGQLAEIINRLWGANTRGGRLYPEAVPRDIIFVGWAPEGGHFAAGLIESLKNDEEHAGWTCLILRAVFNDGWLHDFDSDYESTIYPAEWLWGPGSPGDAVAWFDTHRPDPDASAYIDRWFCLRDDADKPFRPQRVSIFAGLPPAERLGTWHLIQADFPMDAWNHVRSALNGTIACNERGQCDSCAIFDLAMGDWQAVLDAAQANGIAIHAEPSRAIRVPDIGLFSHWG